MASYLELVRQDVCYHGSQCEGTALEWPSPVSQFVLSLLSELKLPRWLRSGPVPYTNGRVLDLLNQVRVSDDAARVDTLWDDADNVIDDALRQRLHATFNTTLTDCDRIRAAVRIEDMTGDLYPKESFIAILIRNAIWNANPELFTLDDVPVVLPRHFSGETIPILNYMTKSFLAPLIISLCEKMPVEKENSEIGHQSDDDDEPSDDSDLFDRSPPTMSEFLASCDRTVTPVEDEEKKESALSPQFEAYFLASRSSATPPTACHIPVLCMADEEQLPILMSSLLYQRRVWQIADPLLGILFSKYDATIGLYVGWLEDDMPSDRVLPRVHIGEIETPMELDLSSPSVALALSRLLCGLERHISVINDKIRQSVGAVISRTKSHSPLSWRIDTDPRTKNDGSVAENNNIGDMVTDWVERQKHSECEEHIPGHHDY